MLTYLRFVSKHISRLSSVLFRFLSFQTFHLNDMDVCMRVCLHVFQNVISFLLRLNFCRLFSVDSKCLRLFYAHLSIIKYIERILLNANSIFYSKHFCFVISTSVSVDFSQYVVLLLFQFS